MTLRIALLSYYHGPRLGVGVFIQGFVAALADLPQKDVEIFVYTNTNTLHHIGPIPTTVHVVRSRLLSLGPVSALLWSALFFPFACRIRRVQAAIILSNPLVLFSFVPILSVIHDLNEFEMRAKYGWCRSFYRRRIMLPSAIRNSRIIATVSEFGKQQIHRFFPQLPDARVFAVPYPPEIEPLAEKDLLPRLDALSLARHGYYLIIGRIDPHGKNLYNALRLFRRLESVHPGRLLILAGGINESTRSEANKFLHHVETDSWLRDRVRYLGFVDDATRAALYQGALALIFYSRFEGFGLPLFEAYKLGCPVIINPACDALVVHAGGAAFTVPESALVDDTTIGDVVKILNVDERNNRLQQMSAIASQNDWRRSIQRYIHIALYGKDLQ
jgi:glycosyltransferase involved in cell wall biosynthesis